ncbi:MAG TPA: hypothetical protein VFM89_06590 [Casimicrobiaceae bacterium]|nr:hypothetical protein [Casimicrobiaceae bacterium]
MLNARSIHNEREHALDLIGQIYDASLEPSRWSDVIGAIVEFVGGAKGVLFASPASAGEKRFMFPFRLSDAFVERWQERYGERDPWSQEARRKGLDAEGTVALGTDLASDAQLRRSAACRELAQHEDIGQLCTAVVFGAQSTGAPPTRCSAFRSIDDAKFSERERERMRVLVPHLSRALGVMFRLRGAESAVASSLAALDRLAQGVLLLDERGHAVFTNRSAERMLNGGNALVLRSAHLRGESRRIVAHEAAVQTRIDAAIRECLDDRALVVRHFSRGVAVRGPSGDACLTLQFAALPRANEYDADGRRARVIVFLNDPNEPAGLDSTTLSRLYRLTPAESRLAIAIGVGETLAEAARRHRIAMPTARTQLAAIFQKTGTTRQAELVRLLASLASNHPR